MIEHPLTLEGEGVKLVPLATEHIPSLLAFSLGDHDRYQYTSAPTREEQVEPYFTKAFTTRDNHTSYPFTILKKNASTAATTTAGTNSRVDASPAHTAGIAAGEAIVGTTRYADIDWAHRNLELGYTWLHPRVEGTAVNVESKYLLLCYVFETLNFYRVQINTDARNERSQAAIQRLGAVYEGTLRRHKIQKRNYLRDTMVFSITDLDWQNNVKQIIQDRLEEKRRAE